MERNQDPAAPPDEETRAELARVQAELGAARQRVAQLEEQLSARSADIDRWASLTLYNLDDPELSRAEKFKALLLGVLLSGAGVLALRALMKILHARR